MVICVFRKSFEDVVKEAIGVTFGRVDVNVGAYMSPYPVIRVRSLHHSVPLWKKEKTTSGYWWLKGGKTTTDHYHHN